MLRWLRNRRRRKWLALPWPEAWSLHLNRNVRLSWYMDEEELAALRKRVLVIVHEKHWEGCNGLELTEEMKVTIAAQAAVMLLGSEDFYFDNVKTILVYPHAFRRKTESGWVMEETARLGEAWQGGPIVLSWVDALRGGRNEDDGHNLVIHEFAHALDGLDGTMGGNLIFADAETMDRWNRIVDHDFQQLVRARSMGVTTLLDDYAATNKAEFFAVASESFFEWPDSFRHYHPELFKLMHQYYRVDPRRWRPVSR